MSVALKKNISHFDQKKPILHKNKYRNGIGKKIPIQIMYICIYICFNYIVDISHNSHL